MKDIIASNLSAYRKAFGITQLELAQKLNYSDKAISKWENGEAFPDIFIFIELTKLYNITLNDFLVDEEKKKIKKAKYRPSRALITIVSAFGLLSIATLIYFLIETLSINMERPWLVFIYAFPIIFLDLMVFSFIWSKRWVANLFCSLLMWSLVLLFFLVFELSPFIFVIGAAMQAVIGIAFWIKPVKK